MIKNGFTLIELLAVIVILAIIALIATPIILGIINDAREKANERSVELYASAVRNGIAAYQLTNANAPISFSDLTIQYDGDVVCSVQELYEDGSFYLEGCKVNNGEKEYSYGTKQGTTIEVGKMSICNPLNVQTEGVYTAGDKYECDVDPKKQGYDYIFYVLNATSTEVNLIMDSNINISGEAVKEGVTDKGLIAWYTVEESNNYGPITAMEYLQSATAGWTNANELKINTFTDDEGNTHEMQEYIVNARMPYISEVETTGCDIENDKEGTCPLWMVNYLDASPSLYPNKIVVSGYGYWTLSSYTSYSDRARFVGYYGCSDVGFFDFDGSVYDDSVLGVRPVINLSI